MTQSELTAPLIGLPIRMDAGGKRQYLSREYADSVAACGGVPVVLPLLEDPRPLRSLVGRLDGILLTGSSTDVDPGRYGAEKRPECGPVQPLRDGTDFLLLEAALEERVPVLAICYGMQSLNVFLGGSLIQDIPSAVSGALQHSYPQSNGKPCHEIEIAGGSVLEELAGGRTARVNSTHHQAVERMGRDLLVIARAADGVVESVIGVLPDHWVLGVQWHPERSFRYDPFSRKVFERFLAECRASQASHGKTRT